MLCNKWLQKAQQLPTTNVYCSLKGLWVGCHGWTSGFRSNLSLPHISFARTWTTRSATTWDGFFSWCQAGVHVVGPIHINTLKTYSRCGVCFSSYILLAEAMWPWERRKDSAPVNFDKNGERWKNYEKIGQSTTSTSWLCLHTCPKILLF